MRLLIISNPEFFPDEAELINSLFREGLACLHIRKPESNENDFRNLIEEIDAGFIDRVSIHQHHHLAKESGIKSLHFTENRRKTTSLEMFRTLAEDDFILSTSIHDLDELNQLSEHFNYTFFGPVFDSISKSGYKSALPSDFLLNEDFKKIPVIALGGINAGNLETVEKMNFEGVAVLGALWQNPGVAVEVFREMSAMLVNPPG